MGDALDDVLGDVLGDNNTAPAGHPASANPIVGAAHALQIPPPNTHPGTRIKLWNVFLKGDRVEVLSASLGGFQQGVVTEVLNTKVRGPNGVVFPVTQVTAMYGERMKKVFCHDAKLPTYFRHRGPIPPPGYVLPPGWKTRDSESTGRALYLSPATGEPSFEWPPSATGSAPKAAPPPLVHQSSFGGAGPPRPGAPAQQSPPTIPQAAPALSQPQVQPPQPQKPAQPKPAKLKPAQPKPKPAPPPKPPKAAAPAPAPPPPPPKPRRAERPLVHNVMASCSLGCAVDLKKLAIYAQGENAVSKCAIEYDPRKFSGLKLRRREPLKTRLVKGDRRTIYPADSTATLFASGKMNTVGCLHETVARRVLRQYARIVQLTEFPASFNDFTVHNIAAGADLGFDVSLQAFAAAPDESVMYEPEINSGAKWEWYGDPNSEEGPSDAPKLHATIFSSGKVNFIGASTRTDIDEAFDYLVPTLATALSSYRTKKIWREYTETYLRIQCAHKCMDTKENYYWPEQVVIMRRFAVEELIRSGGGLIDEDTLGANKKWNHSATAGGMNFAANAPNAKHNVAGGHHNALGAAELVDKACAAASKPFDGGIGPSFADQLQRFKPKILGCFGHEAVLAAQGREELEAAVVKAVVDLLKPLKKMSEEKKSQLLMSIKRLTSRWDARQPEGEGSGGGPPKKKAKKG